jgi:hypothetical protein
MAMIDYSKLPEHIRPGMKFYLERGVMPGSFLQAVLSNNLMESFRKADHINKHRMYDIVEFLYNDAPYDAWGSPAALAQWVNTGGMDGGN